MVHLNIKHLDNFILNPESFTHFSDLFFHNRSQLQYGFTCNQVSKYEFLEVYYHDCAENGQQVIRTAETPHLQRELVRGRQRVKLGRLSSKERTISRQ